MILPLNFIKGWAFPVYTDLTNSSATSSWTRGESLVSDFRRWPIAMVWKLQNRRKMITCSIFFIRLWIHLGLFYAINDVTLDYKNRRVGGLYCKTLFLSGIGFAMGPFIKCRHSQSEKWDGCKIFHRQGMNLIIACCRICKAFPTKSAQQVNVSFDVVVGDLKRSVCVWWGLL